MTNRYENLDTHFIDTSKSFVASREFRNLSEENIVGKYPLSNGDIYLFRIDENDNLSYAHIENLNNESYDGTFKAISPEISFEGLTNILVQESYYEKEKLFYVFYNKDDNLYLRTFHNETFLGEELLVGEDIELYRMERIKENYLIIVKDKKHTELFNNVGKFGDGEFKMLFLFEHDIELFESERVDIMNIQLLDIPFGDIGENNWTDENLVHNNKGYLFITNPNVISVYNGKSINGSVFENPNRVIMELNKETTQYTFTMRFSFEYLSEAYQQLLNTENYRVRVNNSNFVIETVDGDQTLSIFGGISTGTFYNISMTSNIIDNKYILKCHVSNENFNTVQSFAILSETIPSKVDSLMTIDNVKWLDYISVQNFALFDNAIKDIHYAFEKKTLKTKEKRSISLSHNDLNGMVNTKPFLTEFPIFEENKTISNLRIKNNTTLDVEQSDQYVINDDTTVSDVENNVMWQRNGEVDDDIWTNMQAKFEYEATTSDYGGYDGWRLPTLEEAIELGNALQDSSNLAKFNFGDIFSNTLYPAQIWTSDTPELEDVPPALSGASISGYLHYAYDLSSNEVVYAHIFNDKINNRVYLREYDDFTIEYGDGTTDVVPITEGQMLFSTKTGTAKFRRNVGHTYYNAFDIEITYEVENEVEEIKYATNYKLNSALEYRKGRYFGLDFKSPPQDLQGTVLPLFFDNSQNIDIYNDKDDSIRLVQNLSQKFARFPFIMETAGDLQGFVVWTNASSIGKRVGVQYEPDFDRYSIRPTFQEYETLSYNTYPLSSYFCAYHFTTLKENRRALIKEITVDNQGEIVFGASTAKNSYLREIQGINFFDNPKRYKTSEFNVAVDVLRNADRESYINNIKDIKLFISEIIDLWKPATASVRKIVEKNTLVMAQLLKDEFTQVLVGLTPHSNVNAFYIRSVESGQVSAVTSSNSYGDEIDWIGIGTLDTPYVKSGVTKIKSPREQTKIFFETRFPNNSYRVFVFTPNNNNYFVPVRDRDGFIVESSSFVEKEVAWIALDTNQVINGSLKWNRGLPQAEQIFDHLDRQQEININSSRHRVDISTLGFNDFQDNSYSVILCPSTNINLWVENKTSGTFDIRRSYAGNDTEVHYMAVKGNSKWWEDISG